MIAMRHPRLAAALVGFSAVLVAACGGGGGGSPNPQPTSSLAPTATPTAQPTPPPTATPAPPTATPTASPAPLPAILVESPAAGASVRSPLRVYGSANTFEAQFRLRLVTARGVRLFDIPVHATSGTGTRGRFDVTVWFTASGPATLTAYEVSMRDGSMVNVSETPVRLLQ